MNHGEQLDEALLEASTSFPRARPWLLCLTGKDPQTKVIPCGTPHKSRHGWTQRGWRLCQGHGCEPAARPWAPWLRLPQLLICCCQVPAASCQCGEGGSAWSANDGLHLESGRVHSQVLPVWPGAWSHQGHQQLEVACAKKVFCLPLGTLPWSKTPLIPVITVLAPSYCLVTTHRKQHLLQSHKSTWAMGSITCEPLTTSTENHLKFIKPDLSNQKRSQKGNSRVDSDKNNDLAAGSWASDSTARLCRRSPLPTPRNEKTRKDRQTDRCALSCYGQHKAVCLEQKVNW